METFNPNYIAVTEGAGLNLFLAVAAVGLLTGWFLIYLPGRLGLTLAFGKKAVDRYDLLPYVSVAAGLWWIATLALLLGTRAAFVWPALAGLAIATVALCRRSGIPVLPKPRALWAKGVDRLLLAQNLVLICAFALIGFKRLAPWFDGNFVIAGAQMARTGTYMPEHSDGQPGMAALVAVVAMFFPKMSGLTASFGWLLLFAPFLLLGISLLIRELTGKKEWGVLGFLLCLYPIVMKAQEIRASVAGFGLMVWALLFTVRWLRDGKSLDLAGAALALASSWNFGQLGAFFYFPLVAFLSFGRWATGDRVGAARAWEILAWTALLEWFHLPYSFGWKLGADTETLLKHFVPGTVCAAIAWTLLWVLRRIPAPRLPSALAILPCLAAVAAGYWSSPWDRPRYNWYHFVPKMWFGSLNFTSYSVMGWAFALALLLALYDIVKLPAKSRTPKQDRPIARVLWLGFGVSCAFQAASSFLIRNGSSIVLGEPAFPWDIWKDTTLYWNPPFMVLAVVYLFQWIARFYPKLPVRALACLIPLLPLQRLEPYQKLWAPAASVGARIENSLLAHHDPAVDHPFRGQQLYSLPLIFDFAVQPQFKMGTNSQREDCPTCTVFGYDFLRGQWPVIDFLTAEPIAPREAFITGDSVSTHEVYLNRQIRYSSGVNTFCPIYIGYLNDSSSYQFYWQPGNYIRRNRHGMAYTISDPGRNLRWLDAAKDGPDLVVDIEVWDTADYELYRGGEFGPDSGIASLEGAELHKQDGPSLGWARLGPGKVYRLRIKPDGGALNPASPIALYPRRLWYYEKHLLESHGADPFGSLGIMRFTGVPAAELTIDEIERLMTTSAAAERAELVRRYKIRYLVLDPLLRQLYPQADALLGADPQFKRVNVAGTPVYRFAESL